MNKILLLAGVACALSFNANATDVKPYVGFDYVRTIADSPLATSYNSAMDDNVVENKLHSFDVALGAKFNENFGMEAFYQKSLDADSDYNVTTRFDAFGIDAIGYVPLTEKLEGIASLGIGQYDIEAETLGYKASEDGIGIRYGIGAQYNFNEHWALRGMARYVDLDFDHKSVDHLTEFSLGVRYSF